MNRLIAPSVLSANFLNLEKDIKMLNESQADWIHLDIMDGVFVPNISFGMPIIQSIRAQTTKPLDVHLMIIEPDRYIDEFHRVGADILSVHYEACIHLHRNLQKIRSLGMKSGVVLNPHTPVHVLEDILHETDLVLLMSVNPGFGGQEFIQQTFSKIRALRKMIDEQNANTLIEVDGGVSTANAHMLFEAGADVLVAGNAVFKSENPAETIARLKV